MRAVPCPWVAKHGRPSAADAVAVTVKLLPRFTGTSTATAPRCEPERPNWVLHNEDGLVSLEVAAAPRAPLAVLSRQSRKLPFCAFLDRAARCRYRVVQRRASVVTCLTFGVGSPFPVRVLFAQNLDHLREPFVTRYRSARVSRLM